MSVISVPGLFLTMDAYRKKPEEEDAMRSRLQWIETAFYKAELTAGIMAKPRFFHSQSHR